MSSILHLTKTPPVTSLAVPAPIPGRPNIHDDESAPSPQFRQEPCALFDLISQPVNSSKRINFLKAAGEFDAIRLKIEGRDPEVRAKDILHDAQKTSQAGALLVTSLDLPCFPFLDMDSALLMASSVHPAFQMRMHAELDSSSAARFPGPSWASHCWIKTFIRQPGKSPFQMSAYSRISGHRSLQEANEALPINIVFACIEFIQSALPFSVSRN